MAGGKTSKKTESISLPPELQAAAMENLALAKQVGQLPYTPNYGPQVAALTPAQMSAYDGAQQASAAFGLPNTGPRTGMSMPGVADPVNVGGYSGYSTKPLYEASMQQLPQWLLDELKKFQTPH